MHGRTEVKPEGWRVEGEVQNKTSIENSKLDN